MAARLEGIQQASVGADCTPQPMIDRASALPTVPRRAAWVGNYVVFLVVADGVACATGALIAQFLRFGTVDGGAAYRATEAVPLLAILVSLAVVWVLALALGGVYDPRRLGLGSDEYRRIFDSSVRLLACVAIGALILKIDLARGFVALALPLATVLSVVAHYTARQWLHMRRSAGACSQRVVVVGHEHQVAELIRHFDRAKYAGFNVVCTVIPGAQGDAFHVDGIPFPIVDGIERLLEVLESFRAETVAIADQDILRNGALRRLGWSLEGRGVDLLVVPSVTDVAGPRIAVRPVAGLPLLHVEEPELRGVSRVLKEGSERVAAGLLLAILAPLLALVAVLVKATSPGPALFRQVRIGRDGRPFTLCKFRTMRAAAEAERAHLSVQNELDGVLFKIREDPRRTGFGRVLRRWSLDELPQLWNVMRGQMSLVGPRPPLPGEVELYSDEVRRRLLVKPGLTGLWQVSGRADLPWQEAVRLDLYYVENWSLSLDLVILCKTITAVIRGRGAY